MVDQCVSDLLRYWSETGDETAEIACREATATNQCIDPLLRSSVLCDVDRLTNKVEQLLGNFTTNLVEGWMSIRCKFDGGKHYNRCHRGSRHARCYGAGLRSSLGAMWSPVAWQ